jgi:hypothetical protein
MNYTEDHNGEQVSLHNLAYLVYLAYGQSATVEFAKIAQNHGEAISWGRCVPCEDTAPFSEDTCLVCATTETHP